MPIDGITARHVDRYKTTRVQRVKPITVNKELSTLRAAFNFGWDAFWGTDAYYTYPFLARETLQYLIESGVRLVGVDTLRRDHVGCYGYERQTTPNIDRLAASGVLFTNAHCAAPACNPSRAALLTGIRPSTSGVYHNSQPWRRAMPEAVTLPSTVPGSRVPVAMVTTSRV